MVAASIRRLFCIFASNRKSPSEAKNENPSPEPSSIAPASQEFETKLAAHAAKQKPGWVLRITGFTAKIR